MPKKKKSSQRVTYLRHARATGVLRHACAQQAHTARGTHRALVCTRSEGHLHIQQIVVSLWRPESSARDADTRGFASPRASQNDPTALRPQERTGSVARGRRDSAVNRRTLKPHGRQQHRDEQHSQKQRRRAGRAPARRSTLTPQRGPRAMDARAPRARKTAHRLVALPACLPACPRARTNKRHHHHPLVACAVLRAPKRVSHCPARRACSP